tara:strand:+ start:5198 stop:5956 length:759 start_codon:yes stop_codon:yes gene_type:complete
VKIVIAGYGYVGKAVEAALKSYHEVRVVDPAINNDTITSKVYDALIICVSTPEGLDGWCNMQNVYDVIKQSTYKPILIKSTISLEGWKHLAEEVPEKDISFSPEFLRANTALEDFSKQKTMYISENNFDFWAQIFREAFPDISFKTAPAEELILTKYLRNSFLALKVAYFNQVKDLCDATFTDFETVRRYVTDDKRIGDGHSYVTEEKGFGGHCFPKDTAAILNSAREVGEEFSILRKAVSYNRSIRSGIRE